MANDRIKVVGYAQKVVYTDGIEYRNFTPDLVGVQLASDGNTPLFTMGNFAVTTNLDPKLTKFFTTSNFSNFVTLSSLNVTVEQAAVLLDDNARPILNLDKSKLDYYALFGSLRELMRVSLEDIILKWPASLYLTPLTTGALGVPVTGNTVQNYIYDDLYETSTFRINTSFVNNNFGIVYTTNGSILNTFNEANDLRNFTVNYNSYAIAYNNQEYEILEYTASTYTSNDYAYFKVKGDPFSAATPDLAATYHIKPKNVLVDKFFNELPDLEYYLLSRDVTPIYTASFTYPVKSDVGVIVYVTNSATWPVSDGYNIDFNSSDYFDYATKLLEICDVNDLTSSNLMNRFLVSESITSFDTAPVRLSADEEDDTGQKINKTLQIYGREYDELNRYIIGISFANTVSYDKKDNTPDIYLKNLANVLGWELVSAVFDNDLLTSYVSTPQSTYSGQSVGLTPVEADVELWRRIILNSPWIWKSKGARKSIEFLLRFIGSPKGLIQFNEYIYKADGPIDVELFNAVLLLNGLNNDDLSIYPIDSEGYPRPLADTPDMYFQNYGLWYRETGGTGATIDILGGNNPHVGPYDGGSRYLDQFTCLIPRFSAVTVSSVTTTTDTTNLYSNYDFGSFNSGVTTATTVTSVNMTNVDGSTLDNCIVFKPSIIVDPNPSPILNECGCDTGQIDNVLSLCVSETEPKKQNCPKFVKEPSLTSLGLLSFSYEQYLPNGSVYKVNNSPVGLDSKFTSIDCCKRVGGNPFPYSEINKGVVENKGYICCKANQTPPSSSERCGCFVTCKWMVQTNYVTLPVLAQQAQQSNYLLFKDLDGSNHVVMPDKCNCIKKNAAGQTLTIPVPNITDPFTGQVGVACQLTQSGMADIANGQNGTIYAFYNNKANGVTNNFYPKKIDCFYNQ